MQRGGATDPQSKCKKRREFFVPKYAIFRSCLRAPSANASHKKASEDWSSGKKASEDGSSGLFQQSLPSMAQYKTEQVTKKRYSVLSRQRSNYASLPKQFYTQAAEGKVEFNGALHKVGRSMKSSKDRRQTSLSEKEDCRKQPHWDWSGTETAPVIEGNLRTLLHFSVESGRCDTQPFSSRDDLDVQCCRFTSIVAFESKAVWLTPGVSNNFCEAGRVVMLACCT